MSCCCIRRCWNDESPVSTGRQEWIAVETRFFDPEPGDDLPDPAGSALVCGEVPPIEARAGGFVDSGLSFLRSVRSLGVMGNPRASAGKVEFDGGAFRVYCHVASVLRDLRRIPGHQWDPRRNAWTVPPDADGVRMLLQIARRRGLAIGASAGIEFDRAGAGRSGPRAPSGRQARPRNNRMIRPKSSAERARGLDVFGEAQAWLFSAVGSLRRQLRGYDAIELLRLLDRGGPTPFGVSAAGDLADARDPGARPLSATQLSHQLNSPRVQFLRERRLSKRDLAQQGPFEHAPARGRSSHSSTPPDEPSDDSAAAFRAVARAQAAVQGGSRTRPDAPSARTPRAGLPVQLRTAIARARRAADQQVAATIDGAASQERPQPPTEVAELVARALAATRTRKN